MVHPASFMPPLVTCRRPRIGFGFGSIPPWFVVSHNMPVTNTTSNLALFCAFLTPPSRFLRLHWPLALFPRRSPLVTLNYLHWPFFSRPAPHAGTSGFRSCPDPSPLTTASHRRPTAEGKDRTGPDLNERSLSLSMAPNRAISTEKSIRFSSLAAVGPETIHSRPEALNASGSRPAWRMAISRNVPSAARAEPGRLPSSPPRAVHCFKMPSLAKSPPTCDAFRRSASAMLVTPMVRSKPIVAFRKAAITSGPERLRIRLASSPIVTSRT